jgi:hypothetical protein
MTREACRHPLGIVLLAALILGGSAGSLFLAGCMAPLRREAAAPPPLQVQAPSHLAVAVTGMTKRPMAPEEFTPPQRAGFRWEYQLRISDTGGIGVRLEALHMTVRSLSGITAGRVQSLPSRVEPDGSTPISLQAYLVTSSPDEPGDLVGVHELTFLGTDDRGRAVKLEVRVPLE